MRFHVVLFLFLLLNCAKIECQPRIVGGIAAEIEDFPYQAALWGYRYQRCGAVIIDTIKLLTAAHCVVGFKGYLKVTVGSQSLHPHLDFYFLENIIVHPQYIKLSKDYDVAILILCQPLKYSSTVQPIKLTTEEPKAGEMATVSGWGFTSEDGQSSNILRAVKVPIIDRETCQRDYYSIEITNRMICALDKEGGKDSCIGDSGGPLVINNTLVGLVSFGTGCARRTSPGVYTNIFRLKDWIESHE